MADVDPVDLPELRRLAEAATPGPWGWRGYDDGLVELRGDGPYGPYDGRVVSTLPAEPCVVTLPDESVSLTYEACDDCKAKWAAMVADGITEMWEGYHCRKAQNFATLWLRGDVGIEPANTWAVREVPYRSEVASVDHPDAAFIAATGPGVVLALLDRIDALEAGLRGVGELADEWRGALADPALDDALGHGWTSCLMANLPALEAACGAVAGEPESEETTGG